MSLRNHVTVRTVAAVLALAAFAPRPAAAAHPCQSEWILLEKPIGLNGHKYQLRGTRGAEPEVVRQARKLAR